MNFDFQAMKPVIQAEFDAVFQYYPTDMSAIAARVPTGGDAYVRKLAVVEAIAELAPVHVFHHYPFAYEVDCGVPRDQCHNGIGILCYERSGVDYNPLWAFCKLLVDEGIGTFNGYTDHLHRTLDHHKLLRCGFRGVYEECARLNETEPDPEKKAYREVVMRVCLAVKTLGQRLRAQAAEKLSIAPDEDARHCLSRIANSVNTPWEKPETMFDALNSLLCAALMISHMDGIATNALGQVDQLVYPFYQRDLQQGRITEAEAYYLIQCFLFKTDGHAHFNETRTMFDNGVTVMIGGCTPEGEPVFNAVTEMILRAYRETPFINPKLNARAGSYSPRAYLKQVAELMLLGRNNVIIENDDHIIPMFQRMGLSAEDARCYIGGGCQEVITRNQLHSRAFCYLNLVRVLQDTLEFSKTGVPDAPYCRIYQYGRFETGTFAQLMESYLANLRSYIRTLAELFHPYEVLHPTINPEPMLSAFTADCVAKGRDITQGGARCYNKTLSLFGFGTLCDSLLSLKAAYETGSVDTLLTAVSCNFAGYEKLRKEIRTSPNRFGHSPQADEFARELADQLAGVSRGIRNAQGIEWRTSLFTYYLFSRQSNLFSATPDGRLAGEPYSRQMNMASIPELTDAATSLSSICNADFHDVGMFDIALPLGGGSAACEALTDYLAACIRLNIPVVQVNVVDRQKLLEERRCKGTHPEIQVRICGYSAPFTLLSEQMQDEIISRTA